MAGSERPITDARWMNCRRVIRPLAANRTLVEAYAFRAEGAPELLFERALSYNRLVFSPMSVVAHDDVHLFESMQKGLRAEGKTPGVYVGEVSFPLTITRLDFAMAAEDTPSIESVIFDVSRMRLPSASTVIAKRSMPCGAGPYWAPSALIPSRS